MTVSLHAVNENFQKIHWKKEAESLLRLVPFLILGFPQQDSAPFSLREDRQQVRGQCLPEQRQFLIPALHTMRYRVGQGRMQAAQWRSW